MFEALGRLPRRVLSVAISPVPKKVSSISLYGRTAPYPAEAAAVTATAGTATAGTAGTATAGEGEAETKDEDSLASGQYDSASPIPDGTSRIVFDSTALATGTLRNQDELQLLCPPPPPPPPENMQNSSDERTNDNSLTGDIICALHLNKGIVGAGRNSSVGGGDADRKSVSKKIKKKDVVGSTAFWFHMGLLPRNGVVQLDKLHLDGIFKKFADEKKIRKDPHAWPSEQTVVRVEFSTLDDTQVAETLSAMSERMRALAGGQTTESQDGLTIPLVPGHGDEGGDTRRGGAQKNAVPFKHDWWIVDKAMPKKQKKKKPRLSFSHSRFNLLLAETETQKRNSISMLLQDEELLGGIIEDDEGVSGSGTSEEED